MKHVYIVRSIMNRINREEIVSETDLTITIKCFSGTRRLSKKDNNIFYNFKDAKNYLAEYTNAKIKELENRLIAISQMKEPE